MDSITHTLYKAIAADDAHQQKMEDAGFKTVCGGLRPLAERPSMLNLLTGAEGTDLHIALSKGPELLALHMEFIAGGFCPPAGLSIDGAEVIISPGRIDLHTQTGTGDATWVATLARDMIGRSPTRRVGWTETVL